MCGITGVYYLKQKADNTALQRMADTLVHRGPDESGTFTDGNFGMAHTRLSIIDLAGGHQPLYADHKNLVLIANGEIYNFIELRQALEKKGHQFATHSDCEVILHAYREYGDEFIHHLNGMFAFALYDKTRNRLILARDRLGIKPLFLAHLPNGIAFASEIKALLTLKEFEKNISPVGLVQYLQHQFNSGQQTIFQNTERVMPGEAVIIEKGKIKKRWRYWSAFDTKVQDISFEEAQERFDELMETVMREHMRSDVPFGLFLSGGVDSSVLLALLSRYKQEPVRTFSVGFQDTGITDELPVAEQTAKRFGSRHTEIKPTRTDILHSLPYTVWAADDLMRDYASLPTALLAQTASEELKVVFSGEGGDETFAGYGRYRSTATQRWLTNLLASGSGGFRTRGTIRGKWNKTLLGDALLRANNQARATFTHAWQESPVQWTDLKRMQYTDLSTALPDNLLVKLDRMLMAASLEGRVPFVDHRIVEFGLSLPDHLKVEGRQGKIFLKRWASRFLPEELLFARKKGFGVPVGEWLKGDYLTRLYKVLPTHPAILNWFHPEGVARLMDQYKTGGPISQTVWALLQFAIWHDLFIEGNGDRPSRLQDPVEFISR